MQAGGRRRAARQHAKLGGPEHWAALPPCSPTLAPKPQPAPNASAAATQAAGPQPAPAQALAAPRIPAAAALPQPPSQAAPGSV
jgi:hypothetical protein